MKMSEGDMYSHIWPEHTVDLSYCNFGFPYLNKLVPNTGSVL